jgi:hypothetical protein
MNYYGIKGFITFSISTTFWLEYPKEVSSSKSLLRERGAYLQYHLCKLKIAMGLLNYYGIKGPLIKWFENYLHQRKQKVINRATSSTVCEVSVYQQNLLTISDGNLQIRRHHLFSK